MSSAKLKLKDATNYKFIVELDFCNEKDAILVAKLLRNIHENNEELKEVGCTDWAEDIANIIKRK